MFNQNLPIRQQPNGGVRERTRGSETCWSCLYECVQSSNVHICNSLPSNFDLFFSQLQTMSKYHLHKCWTFHCALFLFLLDFVAKFRDKILLQCWRIFFYYLMEFFNYCELQFAFLTNKNAKSPWLFQQIQNIFLGKSLS